MAVVAVAEALVDEGEGLISMILLVLLVILLVAAEEEIETEMGDMVVAELVV